MKMKQILMILFLVCLVATTIILGLNKDILANNGNNNLAQNFKNPPQSAWPWVYWWWLEGNVTREGITRDLEEMRDKGIGGALIFDAGSSNYRVATRAYFFESGVERIVQTCFKGSGSSGNRDQLKYPERLESRWANGSTGKCHEKVSLV